MLILLEYMRFTKISPTIWWKQQDFYWKLGTGTHLLWTEYLATQSTKFKKKIVKKKIINLTKY